MLTVFLIWPTHALDSKNKSQRQQISHTTTEMSLAWENKLREKIQSKAQSSLWKWCVGLALVQRCSLHSWGSTAGSGRVGFASPCLFDVLAILPHWGAMQNAPCRAHKGSTLPHAIQLDMAGTSAWLPWKSLSLRSNKWAENRKKKSELCLLKCPRPLLPHHPVKTSSSCMIQGSFTSFVFPGLYQLSQPLQPSSVAGLNESQLISAWFTRTHQLQLPATCIWLQIKSWKKENTGFPYRNCTQLLQN